MSLDWSLEKVQNWEQNCYIKIHPGDNAYNQIQVQGSHFWFFEKDEMDQKTSVKKCMNPISDYLISLTMVVGLGGITEKNIDEWQFRIWIKEQLYGNTMAVSRWDAQSGQWLSSKITVSDLKQHIGLSTNVSDMTRNTWLKKIFGQDYLYTRKLKERWE